MILHRYKLALALVVSKYSSLLRARQCCSFYHHSPASPAFLLSTKALSLSLPPHVLFALLQPGRHESDHETAFSALCGTAHIRFTSQFERVLKTEDESDVFRLFHDVVVGAFRLALLNVGPASAAPPAQLRRDVFDVVLSQVWGAME